MFGFSSLRCVDCEYVDPKDRNSCGEAYCSMEKDYVSLDSHTCRYFRPNYYVMTAYCNIKGLPYECNEMITLIGLRDEYMINNQVGQEFLSEYETIGPLIAIRLQCDMYRSDIVKEMEEEYILPAIHFINSGLNEEAQETYIEMIEKLKIRYGYAPIKKQQIKEKYKRF